MILALLAVIALAAGGAYWLVKRRQPPPAPVAAPFVKTGGRFSAVEIRTHGAACRSAHALRGKRFLAKDAPTLPLKGCTFGQCTCTFSKLKDRRTEGRRLDYGALNASLLLTTNRRVKKDRRGASPKPQRV